MNSGVNLIAAERQRQVDQEGWSLEHDAAHDRGILTWAAIAYAQKAYRGHTSVVPWIWPWKPEDWKPSSDPIRNLVKAGALIAAEIDRLIKNPEQ